MKTRFPVLGFVLAVGLVIGACSSPVQNNGTGGASGTGGSSSGGNGGNACPDVSACGGDVVGDWSAASSCLTLSGDLDISLAGLDPRSCNNVKVSGMLNVTGSWSAKADSTYTDGTMTKGTVHLAFPAGCLKLSGTTTTCDRIAGPLSGVGFNNASCQDAPGGGCTCDVTIDQKGSLGQPTADPQKVGNFLVTGNMLTLDGQTSYGHCLSGGKLTVTPVGKNFKINGTVEFQSAASGTGGAPPTGGAAGGTSTGGAVGTGGIAGTGGRGGQGGGPMGGRGGMNPSTGGAGGGQRGEGPCDIYQAGNAPCVAAYSTIRALTKAYAGPLYQIRNGSSSMNTGTGGKTMDILLTADGYADTSPQDSFCAGTTCTISLLYDQSGKGNNLKVAPKGRTDGGAYAAMDDFESSATKGQMMLNGHKVYSLYMAAREGYRLTAKGAGMPLGNTAEGIYILADGTHYGKTCCWDFGNVSIDPLKYGVMNTIFFGTGYWGTGAGDGPWFMGDFEGGVWSGGSGPAKTLNSSNPSMAVPFALGILKTSPGKKYALRMADVQKATDLTTAYDGVGPKDWANEGGILLGIGGDNSNNSWGTFYEGAITSAVPSTATDLAVMKNIQAAGYGK